jgi:hypothetical protein
MSGDPEGCTLFATFPDFLLLCKCEADTLTQIAWKTAYRKERSIALDGTRCDGWVRRAREMDGEESEV